MLNFFSSIFSKTVAVVAGTLVSLGSAMGGTPPQAVHEVLAQPPAAIETNVIPQEAPLKAEAPLPALKPTIVVTPQPVETPQTGPTAQEKAAMAEASARAADAKTEASKQAARAAAVSKTEQEKQAKLKSIKQEMLDLNRKYLADKTELSKNTAGMVGDALNQYLNQLYEKYDNDYQLLNIEYQQLLLD